ncbi:ribbon-helix-helix domain-containing protein [Amycolatopsis nigrescens]|uniref:ribbon-helix-helix domain-containing protein n=1 Tax=Amycolatopsis nigrescens TaxID=381445 RepID=UPI00036C7E0C|nr:ribbon-helix-helix domain-containing protein [Amycolatopsis nigrescens]
MKLSVSLAADDVAFLDDYAAKAGVASRSAAIQRAIELLRASQLEDAYSAAWDEWSAGDDEPAWQAATGDGVLAGPAR